MAKNPPAPPKPLPPDYEETPPSLSLPEFLVVVMCMVLFVAFMYGLIVGATLLWESARG